MFWRLAGPAGMFGKQPHYTQLQEPASVGGFSGNWAANEKETLELGQGGEGKIDRHVFIHTCVCIDTLEQEKGPWRHQPRRCWWPAKRSSDCGNRRTGHWRCGRRKWRSRERRQATVRQNRQSAEAATRRCLQCRRVERLTRRGAALRSRRKETLVARLAGRMTTSPG